MFSLVFWLLTATVHAAPQESSVGDAPIEAIITTEAESRSVVPLSYAELRELAPDNLYLATAFDLGLIHRGTPYKWGGDDWTSGIDCSHFTRHVFADAGTAYTAMMTTAQLRDLKRGNGLHAIALSNARAGDLFVYGAYDNANTWHGHVVVLLDADYRFGGYQGLVVGSHGDVGVQFMTVAGFPLYWRQPNIQLRNVLRVDL